MNYLSCTGSITEETQKGDNTYSAPTVYILLQYLPVMPFMNLLPGTNWV